MAVINPVNLFGAILMTTLLLNFSGASQSFDFDEINNNDPPKTTRPLTTTTRALLPKPASPSLPNSNGAACPNTTPAENKALAIEFSNALFNIQQFAKVEQLMDENYVDHNQFAKNGLLNRIPSFLLKTPKGSWELKHAIADEDLVWLHSKFPIQGKDYVLSDTYRIKCGKIIEHWDVIQEIKADAPNPVAYF